MLIFRVQDAPLDNKIRRIRHPDLEMKNSSSSLSESSNFEILKEAIFWKLLCLQVKKVLKNNKSLLHLGSPVRSSAPDGWRWKANITGILLFSSETFFRRSALSLSFALCLRDHQADMVGYDR